MNDTKSFFQQVVFEFEQRPPYKPEHEELIKATPLDENRVPVDNQIRSTLEDLRCLKHQLTALRSKEIFLRKLRDAATIEELPSAEEAVAVDLRVRMKKSELRKQKAARAAAEQRFEKAVELTCSTERRFHDAHQVAQNRIKRIHSTAYKNKLAEKMLNGDWENVVRSFDDITEVDKLDGPDCEELSTILKRERFKLETEANQKNAEVTQLQKRLNRAAQSVEFCETELKAIKQRLAKKERVDRKFGNALHEYELQKYLAQILPIITGVRVAEVRPDSISFEINATLFVPSDGKADRSQATHHLMFKTDEVEGKAGGELILSPADVEVADLVDEQANVVLPVVVKEVCARLREFMANKRLGTTASEIER